MMQVLNHGHIEEFKKELASEEYQKAIIRYISGTIISIQPYYPGREFTISIRPDSQEDREFYGHSFSPSFFYHAYKGEYFDSRAFKAREHVRVGLNPLSILMSVERLDEAQPIRCECCGSILE